MAATAAITGEEMCKNELMYKETVTAIPVFSIRAPNVTMIPPCELMNRQSNPEAIVASSAAYRTSSSPSDEAIIPASSAQSQALQRNVPPPDTTMYEVVVESSCGLT